MSWLFKALLLAGGVAARHEQSKKKDSAVGSKPLRISESKPPLGSQAYLSTQT